jgi:hypothetical protein
MLLLSVFMAAHVSLAHGQSFTLSSSALSPSAGVNPGDSATATVVVQSTGGFADTVSLSCAVTSNQFTSNLPVCGISPATVTPDASSFLTITTTGGTDGTQAGIYNIAVTGVSGAITQTVNLSMNVTDITQDYTILVTSTTATPGTVTAGQTATAQVTVTPIGSYSGTVTLACLAITPVVTDAPVCSFAPSTGTAPGPVQIGGGQAATAILTITTLGPNPTTRLRTPRIFYALWLLLPGLALTGVGTAARRRKSLLGIFLLLSMVSGLLLLPACGSTNNTNNPSGEVTPKNTYTFTLTGADQNGAAPGNSATAPTVTLTVN